MELLFKSVLIFVVVGLGWKTMGFSHDPITSVLAYNNILTNDEKAPDFVVETLEGEQVALSDFKGKVVYISFWASWCKPCISGFNKYADLRQKVQDLGVVMLNVSIDKTEAAWHRGLKTIPDLGIQAFAKQDKTQLMHDYELGSIPAYYIVNKKGNFAYLSYDPNRDIVEEFRKILNEE